MNYRFFLLFISFSILSGNLQGQKVKKIYRSTQETSVDLIQDAKSKQIKNPTQAISLLEKAISLARKEENLENEASGYILLGNIFEDIDQKDLALQRYLQALPLFKGSNNVDLKAEVHKNIGSIYLDQGDLKAAIVNFNICIKESGDRKLTLRCEEGKADVALREKDTDEVTKQLNTIEQNYELDSLSLAGNMARRAQNYATQNDYDNAYDSYNKSVSTLPKNKKVSEKDLSTLQKSQTAVLEIKPSTSDEIIDIRKEFAVNSNSVFPNNIQVKENLKIAALYEAKKNYPEAIKYIIVSKKLIEEMTSPAIAAEVYKKSSELNQKLGNVNDAIVDLELYITSKEKALQDLEVDLKKQVEIVKGQQRIDINRLDDDLSAKDSQLIQSQIKTQKILIGLLSILLLGSLVFFYFLTKSSKERRKTNQKLYLKSLRTQMNPHFIFNALNSVNSFIAKNDEKAANKFLADFSRLMRKVLDHSQKDFIAFEEEIELNELYLKLEHFRFRDKFDYTFTNNAPQLGYNLEVPPMLIQPFIENAVWHGLRYKEEKGNLEVSINEEKESLVIYIKDNGIGRKKSKALKTENQKKYKSTGLDNVSKRVALINELYKKNYLIHVSDLDNTFDNPGTLVKISIPKES